MAVAIALAETGGRVPAHSAFLGELALDGAVRHVDGVLVAARCLKKLGYERLFVPAADAEEAALVDSIDVIPCGNVAEVVAHLRGSEQIAPQPFTDVPLESSTDILEHDLAEVHGQEEARRAIEVAAAGGHHLLLSGPARTSDRLDASLPRPASRDLDGRPYRWRVRVRVTRGDLPRESRRPVSR
jgi:magnesium chelatase family protein